MNVCTSLLYNSGMQKKQPLEQLSLGEEIGNAITHGFMATVMLIALPISAIYSYTKGGWTQALGVSVFVISLLLMFLSSTLYHAMAPKSKHKLVMQTLDHIFIYVAIAGSYTPVAISLIGGWKGMLILIIQWTMVFVGVLYKSLIRHKVPKASLTIYLTMGWIAVLFIPDLVRTANIWFGILIALGGIFYSAGAWFYSQKHRPYFHFIWHLFINIAAATHFIAILFFI